MRACGVVVMCVWCVVVVVVVGVFVYEYMHVYLCLCANLEQRHSKFCLKNEPRFTNPLHQSSDPVSFECLEPEI